MNDDGTLASSFRDPSGFLFRRDGVLYRQINVSYREHYDHLINSGLYASLLKDRLIIPQQEVNVPAEVPNNSYKVVQPGLVPLISYPYEWCFSQLKDAALATLLIQKKALRQGMVLKDASAYNIQFVEGKLLLIDTLSFEIFREGQPWIAYRQFCQHFLAPLALMSLRDVRLSQLLRIYLDGIPLDLASSLLPRKTRFSLSLLSHLHIHARSQKRYAGRKIDARSQKMSRLAFEGLMDSLETAVRKLDWEPARTEWADYYTDTNYSDAAFDQKKELLSEMIDQIRPRSVLDLGANIGIFSRIASGKGIQTISVDGDPAAVEKNYRQCSAEGEKNLIPLWVDLTNPGAASGWENEERASWMQRCQSDCVVALALIHHLAISNNVPFSGLARFFAKLGKRVIIEFVPKSDSQAQRLLSSRVDIFSEYTQGNFEVEFEKEFKILSRCAIKDSERTIYLMEKIPR